METRQPKFIISVGIKGIGKTYQLYRLIQEYVTPNKITGRKARKIILFDIQREYDNRKIQLEGFRWRSKVLDVNDLERWIMQSKIEIRRILPINEFGKPATDKEEVEILSKILQTARGCMLILEDLNRYIITTDTRDIIGAIISNRHKDLDLCANLQSLAPISPRMWQNVNYIKFFHISDSIDRYKNRIPNFDLFKITQILVDGQYFNGNKRFFVWVDCENEKIIGKFNLLMYNQAAEEYIKTHRAIMRPYLDLHKGKSDTYLLAMKDAINSFGKYYGNK